MVARQRCSILSASQPRPERTLVADALGAEHCRLRDIEKEASTAARVASPRASLRSIAATAS